MNDRQTKKQKKKRKRERKKEKQLNEIRNNVPANNNNYHYDYGIFYLWLLFLFSSVGIMLRNSCPFFSCQHVFIRDPNSIDLQYYTILNWFSPTQHNFSTVVKELPFKRVLFLFYQVIECAGISSVFFPAKYTEIYRKTPFSRKLVQKKENNMNLHFIKSDCDSNFITFVPEIGKKSHNIILVDIFRNVKLWCLPA